MSSPGTVALIFIDGRTLRTKRLVDKFKQRTKVPHPYHYKNGVPFRTRSITKKAYRTAVLDLQHFTTYALSWTKQ